MHEAAATTRLVGGQVIDIRTGAVRRLDVMVAGERIAQLAAPGEAGPDQSDADVSGLFLLPGMIDCHVHLVMRGEDPDPAANASRSDEEIRAHAALAAEITLLGGVTSVRDVGGWNYVEMAVRGDIEQGKRIGPRLVLAGRLLSMPTEAVEYYPGMYEVATGTEAVARAARRQLARGADMIKVMATGAMLSPEGEDARTPQFGQEEMRAAVGAAGESGGHVAAHAHALEGVRNAVLAGVRSIEHGTYAAEDALGLMAERGVFLVPTFSPWTSLREIHAAVNAMPEHIRARLSEAHETHAGMVRSAAKLGVPIAMGTDAGTPGNHHGANALECVAMVEEGGLSPGASVRAATL
ncbi:MAG TPA: amidohydrolase family protein, partial [Actinomycetota bacterium]|nr:amidohydrolase family protein [Actinomycetota bacterium]